MTHYFEIIIWFFTGDKHSFGVWITHYLDILICGFSWGKRYIGKTQEAFVQSDLIH